MHPSLRPPRQVKIGDAASFVGVTPRAIRHYHQIGVLPEPERGGDGRRRYGYDEMLRLLWIRTMADAGIALDDIRDAFADTAPAHAADDREVADLLERLERRLAEQEAELRRQRATVQRMRTRGSRLGLLSDVVADRLDGLPSGSLRQTDLDALLVTERMLGPLVAAIQASRCIALATHPDLRDDADRVDAAEEALDDTIAVDDPCVAQVAAQRHAFEQSLHARIDASALAQEEQSLLDDWDALHAGDADEVRGERGGAACSMQRTMQAARAMPYDLSPARLRCMELALAMDVDDASLAPDTTPAPPQAAGR